MPFSRKAYFNTSSKTDAVLVSHDVKRALQESQVSFGLIHLQLPLSTAAFCLLENDPTIIQGYKEFIEKQIPEIQGPRPSRKSGTGHIHAHLRAQFLQSNICLAVANAQLQIGPWQDIFVFDFDDKIGRKEFLIHVLGETPAPK